MRILNLFILSTLALGCSKPSCQNHSDEQQNEFELNLEVRPSFTPNVRYRLRKSPGKCELNDIEYQLACKDSLLSKYFMELEQVLSSVNSNQSIDTTNIFWGLDGTSSTIEFKYLDSTRTLKFDNSGENEILNQFIPPIYNIIHYLNDADNSELKLTEKELEEFELSEESVINFPIRLVSERPLKYRLYSRVYYCCYEDVIELLNSFPSDELTYIEVSRFYTINRNDRFYDSFVNDISKRKNLRWIVENENRQELIDLGIPKRNIINADYSH